MLLLVIFHESSLRSPSLILKLLIEHDVMFQAYSVPEKSQLPTVTLAVVLKTWEKLL